MKNIDEAVNSLQSLEFTCSQVAELRKQKKLIEDQLKEMEGTIKSRMAEAGLTTAIIGPWGVNIKRVAESRIVDTAKLKADGLFESYSKIKAGYDTLSISYEAGNRA